MAEPVGPAGRLGNGWSVLACRLAWCAPAIFLIGVPALLLTREVYGFYYPQAFVRAVPSISETAAHSPSADLFQWMMFAVTLCIFVCWPLNYGMNRDRLMRVAGGVRTRDITLANAASALVGLAAGFFLAALGMVRLHDGRTMHDLHIELSILFYGAQVAAFLLDGWCAIRLRTVSAEVDGPAERLSLRSRAVIAAITLVMALWFLYQYLDRDGFFGLLVGQQVYVATEYILAILCLAYPVAPFPEVRRHFQRLAEPTAPRAELRPQRA